MGPGRDKSFGPGRQTVPLALRNGDDERGQWGQRWPSIPSGEVTGTTLQGREKYDGPGTAKEEATQFPPRSL